MAFPKGVKRDFTALEQRRLEAVRLIFEEGLSQSEAARRVGAAQQSVNGWVKRYREEGQGGLCKADRAGRKPLLDRQQLEQLEVLLLEGPEAHGFPTPLWSCPRVARLIRERFGVDYHEGHVWKLLRSLNWSPQRPVGKARERNEEAIREWKRVTWPAIKKKPKNRAARSSSSTKAD
jgi:transposase